MEEALSPGRALASLLAVAAPARRRRPRSRPSSGEKLRARIAGDRRAARRRARRLRRGPAQRDARSSCAADDPSRTASSHQAGRALRALPRRPTRAGSTWRRRRDRRAARGRRRRAAGALGDRVQPHLARPGRADDGAGRTTRPPTCSSTASGMDAVNRRLDALAWRTRACGGAMMDLGRGAGAATRTSRRPAELARARGGRARAARAFRRRGRGHARRRGRRGQALGLRGAAPRGRARPRQAGRRSRACAA